MTLIKENQIINKPPKGRNSYFTVSDENTDYVSSIMICELLNQYKRFLGNIRKTTQCAGKNDFQKHNTTSSIS